VSVFTRDCKGRDRESLRVCGGLLAPLVGMFKPSGAEEQESCRQCLDLKTSSSKKTGK